MLDDRSRSFIELLKCLTESKKNAWFPFVKNEGIFLHRLYSTHLFSPRGAVYFEESSVEIHHGSFWCPELEKFGFKWFDLLEIAHAEIASGRYNKELREAILIALGLQELCQTQVGVGCFESYKKAA